MLQILEKQQGVPKLQPLEGNMVNRSKVRMIKPEGLSTECLDAYFLRCEQTAERPTCSITRALDLFVALCHLMLITIFF